MIVVHVLPVDDLLDHEYEDCACGPEIKEVEGGEVIVHYSLDGREESDPWNAEWTLKFQL
jgi:hypothetical protein